MSDRSQRISSLLADLDSRTSYIRSKLGVLVPSQIRSLRLNSNMPRQSDLAKTANMHQSRISMFETPGAANLTLETLSRLAAAFRVGLKVEFVPFSEMLEWENGYSQDNFAVTKIEDDSEFLQPSRTAQVRKPLRQHRRPRRVQPNIYERFQMPIGNDRSTYAPALTERVQLRLAFEPLGPPIVNLRKVIAMPSGGSAFHVQSIPKTAYVGARGTYGNY